MKCIKCGDEHKISYDYNVCEKCGGKQFHLIKRIIESKSGTGFPLIIWIILMIVMIAYFIVRILKLLNLL